jgi:hypothetical protein
VTWAPQGARRLIGAGLLLPGLLLNPLDTAAAAPTVKTPPQAHTAKELRAKTQPLNPQQPARVAVVKRRSGRTGPMGARSSPGDRCVHVVRRGDTLGRLTAQYRVSPQRIIATNRLGAAGTLSVGQRISVPGCKAGMHEEQPSATPAVELESGLLLARVGPDRIPTRLFVAIPEFGADAIEFAWPVEGMVASGFGKRRMGWHAGIDIKAEMGTPVLAAAAGTVSFSGWAASYGRLVKIQHPNGFVTVYAHNNENLVQVGDEVGAGTMIATVGRSGRASDHHLHFEIRREGMAFNPVFLLESRDHTPVFASTPAEPLEIAEPLDEEADDDSHE